MHANRLRKDNKWKKKEKRLHNGKRRKLRRKPKSIKSRRRSWNRRIWLLVLCLDLVEVKKKTVIVKIRNKDRRKILKIKLSQVSQRLLWKSKEMLMRMLSSGKIKLMVVVVPRNHYQERLQSSRSKPKRKSFKKPRKLSKLQTIIQELLKTLWSPKMMSNILKAMEYTILKGNMATTSILRQLFRFLMTLDSCRMYTMSSRKDLGPGWPRIRNSKLISSRAWSEGWRRWKMSFARPLKKILGEEPFTLTLPKFVCASPMFRTLSTTSEAGSSQQ